MEFKVKEDEEEPMDVAENSSTLFSEQYTYTQLPDLLRVYYSWLFPFREYFNWLCYDRDSFMNREFSFTLHDDIYVRYQSFVSRDDLEESVKKSLPYKIDIGAIFNHKPREHKKIMPGNFRAMKKELVFDIDMTDYDEVRTCCSEAKICNKCWRFIIIAIKIIDRALRDDFGFKHLLWVYSGRRGCHCWVCDQSARELSQEARIAIVEYLTLIKGGEHTVKKVNISSQNLHPSIKRALEVIEKEFKQLVEEQDILSCPEEWKKILALLPGKAQQQLNTEWNEKEESSWERWKSVLRECKLKPWLEKEIMLQWAYPRLDVNVSKGINHLLKSPFCVHPKTGRVCVPIDPGSVERFDPFQVPTVNELCIDLDNMADLEDKKKGCSRTALGPYVKYFQQFVLRLKSDKTQIKRKQDTLDF